MQRSLRVLAPFKVFVALMLMIVSIIAHVAPAHAQADTYVSEISGDELSWTDDWTPAENTPSVDDGFERFALNGNAGIVIVDWIEGSGIDAQVAETLASLTLGEETFELIDSGVTDSGAAYAFGVNAAEDFDFAIVTYVEEVGGVVRGQTFATDMATVDIALPVAQETVLFNGEPSFAGIASASEDGIELGTPDTGGSDDGEEDPSDDTTDNGADAADDGAEDTTDDGGEEDPTEESSGGSASDNELTIEMTGSEIGWSDDWELEDSLVQSDQDFESVGFINGAWIQAISFMPTGIDLDGARDAFLEGFAGDDVAIQVVDRGSYDNVSYSLDLAEIEGTLFGLFTVYIDDGEFVRSYATLSLESELGEGVDFAAGSITIDGEPIYTGVEGTGLQALIDTAAENFTPTDTVAVDDDGATEESDEPTEEATEEDEDPTEEATEEDEDPTEEATEEDEDPTEESTSGDDEDLEALGLVDTGQYESPQWGTTIDWTRDFELSESDSGPGITSDEDGGVDTVSLSWTDSADGLSSISLTVAESSGSDMAELEEFYTSDDFTSLFTGDTGEVVDSDSTETSTAVLIESESGLLYYFGANEVDGGDTLVTYVAIIDASEGADFQAAVTDGIEVDGEPIMDLLEVE
jgi:hypothetical protein